MAGRVVAILTGSVLLFASLMKGLALADTTISSGRVPGDWWLSLAASVFELFLGVWLIAGVFPATVRRVALVCFLGFAGVALYKVSTSQESCGCLGNLHVNPRHVFVFDILVAFVLWWAHPPRAIIQERRSALVLLTGVLVLAVGLGLTTFERATSLSRGLVASGIFHDFGEVEQHRLLTHDFTLENRCGYPVEVVKTTSTCNCTTVPAATGQVIPAGGRLDVPVTLDTKEYEEEMAGKITLYCRRAGSSSPPGFFQTFVVAATVEPDYWVRPLVLNLGEVDHNRPVRSVIRLRPHRMKDVRVTKVTTVSPVFTGRALKERTPEGDIQIEVAFDGGTLTGTSLNEAPVTIHTSSVKRRAVDVLARVYYRSPITVEPTAVVVASDIAGDVARDIVVTGARPIRVEGVRSPSEVRVEVTTDAPNRWRLQVTIPAETARTGVNGDVQFDVRFEDGTAAAEARHATVPIHRLRAPNQ